MPRTFTLPEVAALYLPHLKDGRRFLSRKIRAGELGGFRTGRHLVMTEADVAHMLRTLHVGADTTVQPKALQREVPPAEPTLSLVDGLSERVRRRRVK